jgi:hypothetical protein
MPTSTVIPIDPKEGVVAVLITTFLDRQLSKVCNLVKREIVTLMGGPAASLSFSSADQMEREPRKTPLQSGNCSNRFSLVRHATVGVHL